MKNFKTILTLAICSIALSACAVSPSSGVAQKVEENKTLSRMITPDYGQHIKGQVCLLFGTAKIPFNLKDYGINYIVAGDQLDITYSGSWLEQLTYPSTIVTKDMKVEEVKVWRARIIEFEMLPNPGGGKSLAPVNPEVRYGQFLTENVINEDGTYQELSTIEEGTKIYATNPAIYDSLNIYAMYSYNPVKAS